MSNTLKQLLQDKKGYRTEDAYGSGVRDIKAVLEYEITELGNDDIPDYLEEHHACPAYPVDNDGYLIEDTDVFNEWWNEVSDIIGKEYVSALWLTDKNSVKELYGNDDTEHIDTYNIPDNALVLSDIDKDGVLFALTAKDTYDYLVED